MMINGAIKIYIPLLIKDILSIYLQEYYATFLCLCFPADKTNNHTGI